MTATLAGAFLLVATPIVLVSIAAGAKHDTDTMAAGKGATAAPINLHTLPTPSPSPSPTAIIPEEPPLYLVTGDTNSFFVPLIQERLMELGYMDPDQPTELYGPNTTEAIKIFQRKHELPITGIVDQELYDFLMSAEAKKYSVSIGVSGSDVYELQIRLRELGYISKATSYFGDETEAAVKRFQELNGLTVDGTVGEQTRELLYSEDAKGNYMQIGDVSDDLIPYQKRLIKLAYLDGEADGVFGQGTKQAIKKFQTRNGLIADGYLGPQTRSLLMSKDAEANTLTIGYSGDDVVKIQKRLKELGYLDAKATGYYGEATEAAVKLFQKKNNLTADGKVGRNTFAAINSDSAKKNTSKPVSSGGSGGSSGGSSGSSGGSGGSSGGSGSGSTSNSASVTKFLDVAQSKLGRPYRRGAKGPDAFDCSGFVYWCLNQAGVKQSYLTSKSWRSVSKYQKLSSMSDIRAGDVIVFYGHVGIALSNSTMIDASSTDGKIRTTKLNQAYWKKNFICAYRIF